MATTLEIAKQHKKITTALDVIAEQLAIRKKRIQQLAIKKKRTKKVKRGRGRKRT